MTTRNPQAAVVAVLRFMCEEGKNEDPFWCGPYGKPYLLRVWQRQRFVRDWNQPYHASSPWRHALEAEQRAFDILCAAVTPRFIVSAADEPGDDK